MLDSHAINSTIIRILHANFSRCHQIAIELRYSEKVTVQFVAITRNTIVVHPDSRGLEETSRLDPKGCYYVFSH